MWEQCAVECMGRSGDGIGFGRGGTAGSTGDGERGAGDGCTSPSHSFSVESFFCFTALLALVLPATSGTLRAVSEVELVEILSRLQRSAGTITTTLLVTLRQHYLRAPSDRPHPLTSSALNLALRIQRLSSTRTPNG